MLDLDRTPRPLRWHEWLLVLLLAAWSAGVHGEVYKCMGKGGVSQFQDHPCATEAAQTVVAIAPAPAYAPSPVYASTHESTARSGSHRSQVSVSASRRGENGGAYECRTSDGQVFYRHGTCPRSVAAVEQTQATSHGHGRGSKAAAAKSVAVTSTRISREEACYQLRRAGAAGRPGREHDQDVSTYDKNLGHDPCR